MVGGRLALHHLSWSEVADDSLLRLVRLGYKIPFVAPPPLTNYPRPFRLPYNREKKALLLQEIASLLQKHALVRVPPQELHKPAFYSLLFLVAKSTGGFRPVIDVSRLNRFVRCPHFKMETARSIVQAVRQGDWSISIDLSDAYLHVLMHPSSRRFLRIALSPVEVYEFRVLPFGLCTAPLVFTRLVTALAASLRRKGVRIHVYLDDWLILAQDRHVLVQQTAEILSVVRSLGFLVNEKKSRLVPAQRFEYLGLLFATVPAMVRPADHLVTKAVAMGQPVSPLESITPRGLMRIIGLFNSLADFVPRGRLFLRPVQFWLRNRWSQQGGELDVSLVVTPSLITALAKWTDLDWLQMGVPLVPFEPTVLLFTDASTWGWGAHLGDSRISGVWTPQERLSHINVLEMRAILNAFLAFRDQVCLQRVLLLTDNATCVSYLKKFGGLKSPDLCDLTWEIYSLLLEWNVDLRVRHIPSRLNVLADALSRPRPLLTEWSLNSHLFKRLHCLVPALSVDLFATSLNKQLPLYVSPFPDQNAVAVDALSVPWDFQGVPFAFPPTILVPLVLSKIRREQVPLVLMVAPCWPQKPWFADLLEMAVANPLYLPPMQDLLSQGLFVHPTPAAWNLHAWLLSGQHSPPLDSLNRWLGEWLELAGSPLMSSTTQSGNASIIGVLRGNSIRSIPLGLC